MCAKQSKALPSTTDREFEKWYRAFENSTPKSYPRISFRIARLLHGPEFPDKAFDNLGLLRKWYTSILLCWLQDVFFPVTFGEESYQPKRMN